MTGCLPEWGGIGLAGAPFPAATRVANVSCHIAYAAVKTLNEIVADNVRITDVELTFEMMEVDLLP